MFSNRMRIRFQHVGSKFFGSHPDTFISRGPDLQKKPDPGLHISRGMVNINRIRNPNKQELRHVFCLEI